MVIQIPSHGGGGKSNPNLLDNWDFTKPVNQRNKTSYTGGGYTIDRWVLDKEQATVSPKSKYLYIANGGVQYSGIAQVLPDMNVLPGETYTFSVLRHDTTSNSKWYIDMYLLDSNGNHIAYSGMTYFTSGLVVPQVSITVPSNATGNLHFHVHICYDGTNSTSVSLKAAKLEKGVVSTIQNDVLGASYPQELKKCRRYYYDTRTDTNWQAGYGRVRMKTAENYSGDNVIVGNIQFPEPMRSTPNITIYSDQGNINKINNGLDGQEMSFNVSFVNFHNNERFTQIIVDENIDDNIRDFCFHYVANADL